jgi:hypothetical protein
LPDSTQRPMPPPSPLPTLTTTKNITIWTLSVLLLIEHSELFVVRSINGIFELINADFQVCSRDDNRAPRMSPCSKHCQCTQCSMTRCPCECTWKEAREWWHFGSLKVNWLLPWPSTTLSYFSMFHSVPWSQARFWLLQWAPRLP